MTSRSEVARMDPATFEVLRNAYRAVCNEGSALLERAAYCPAIAEGKDYSIAILTRDGRFVAHGNRDQTAHFGTFEASLRAVMEDFDEFRPGDVFVFNDPYRGGTHQLDVKLFRPVFYKGELLCWTVACCHWSDCGGPVPGTFNPTATECYAEGLIMPPTKIFEADKPVRSTFRLMEANIRCYTDRVGDAYAQYQAGKLVEQRMQEYCDKFGRDLVEAGFEEVMDYSERFFRSEVAKLPDGVYEFDDYSDRDVGRPDQPRVRFHCKLTIQGDQATLDWTGTDPAPVGPVGFSRPALLSAVYDGTLRVFPQIGSLNHGLIRCLNIVSEPGSAVDVLPPTPQTGYCCGAYEKADAITTGCWSKATVSVNPTYIVCATINLEDVVTGGYHPKTGVPFVSYLWLEGGQGARAWKDGNSYYLPVYVTGACNQPIEVHERWYPMLYSECEVVVDSCGDGKYRGGFGLSRSFYVTGDTTVTIHGDRAEVTPWGLGGGTNGGPNGLVLNRGTPQEEDLGMFAVGTKAKKGDHLYFFSNGGGGYGRPWRREPQKVLDDVIDGYVSLSKAREVYGVAIQVVDARALDYRIDWEETARLRQELETKPREQGVGPWQVHPSGEGVRVHPED
ncbi:MAG: hydantoinase B/oxoprolinase family protein [Dehalococcoidia bacterium]